MEQRNGRRLNCKFAVHVCGVEQNHFYPCHTEDLGVKGARIKGLPRFPPGTAFTVKLEKGPQHHVLEAILIYWQPQGAGLKFRNLSRAQHQFLMTAGSTDWDGNDLLEGVLIAAPCMHLENLGDWLSLTSLLSNRHKRLHAPPIAK